jgi:dGTP triphosphohydrolase
MRARLISDYIAGMTDQYALMEYQKLTDNNFLMG